MPAQPWSPDRPDAIELLRDSAVGEAALLAAGSNYVYLLTLNHTTAGTGYAVYKPQRGEAPLSDFPDGTLYRREYAAYLVSEALGWRFIPPSVIREAGLPYGVGVVQLFIEHDPSQHYFSLRDGRLDEMKRIALFDWITNNADRKGGHTLLANDGRLWCIDQGLTFHVDDKLRTVIWDFQGQPVPPHMLDEVCRFGERLDTDQHLRSELLRHITAAELDRLHYRIHLVDRLRVYPPPPQYRPYPWPMI
jgi:uncharacterized repeat protein (TIGR03843 family)